MPLFRTVPAGDDNRSPDIIADNLESVELLLEDRDRLIRQAGRGASFKWDVFISYSTKDMGLIREIVRDFERRGIRYWLDDEQIMPGDAIVSSSQHGLENSRHILACFSRNQKDSGWHRREYESFLGESMDPENTRKLLPLILDDLPDEELPLFARGIEYVRYSNKENYKKIQKLLSVR